MTKLRAVPNSNPAVESLSGQIRGFATGKRMKDALLNYGLADKHIYMLGSGAEDLDACLRSFRERAGCLVLAEDLQAFGPTKREVSDRADALEKADIRVVDLSHPEDQSYAALVRRAHNFISRNHFVGDRVKARERGAQGGTAKGALAWNRRLMLNVTGAMAQFERDQIIERTKRGMATRKAQGMFFGRKRIVTAEVATKMQALRDAEVPVVDIAEKYKVKPSTVYANTKAKK